MNLQRSAPRALIALVLSLTPAWAGQVKHSITISGSMGVIGSVNTSDFKAFDTSLGTLVHISVTLSGTLDYTGKGIPADEGATLGLADPKRLPDLTWEFFPKIGAGLPFSFVKLNIANAAILSDYSGTGLRHLAVNDVGGNATDHYTLSGSGTVTYDYVAAAASPPVSPWAGAWARLKITVAGPITPPPGSPVEAELGFTDLAGNLIAPLTTVSLLTGQVAWVDLNVNQSMAVRPLVTFPQGASIVSLNATTEIFEGQTGIGRVLTTTTSFPAAPTFSPQGLAGGQVLRMIASSYPPDPCSATLHFTGHDGIAVGPSMQVTLSPGQSQALDLDGNVLGLQAGMRAEIQPMVTLPAAQTSACAVSVQAIDKTTGQTGTYQAIVVSQ
jgi:hypothetical protein